MMVAPAAGAVIVVLSARSDARTIRACLEQGVRGYVVKSPGERPDLAALLRRALTGETILDAHASAALLPGGGSGVLSDRERDVLGLVAEGMTNVEIGARLFLSRHTVKEYLSGAMRKLAVTNRVEAALEAARRGLIDATVATPEQARWILAAPTGRLEIVGSITASVDDHDLRLTPVKVRATTRA
jgi:DNA-binding NarL/FixJ family response regulator